MSEQRNAERDRETIVNYMMPMDEEIALHWLERAVSAEQRVAEMEKALAACKRECEDHTSQYALNVVDLAGKALNGGQET